jgi:CRP-like cAMP-binding protein
LIGLTIKRGVIRSSDVALDTECFSWNDKMETTWIDKFKGLSRLPAEIRDELVSGSEIVRVPPGTQIFAPGQTADNLWLLLDGTVKVQQKSDTGREVSSTECTRGKAAY